MTNKWKRQARKWRKWYRSLAEKQNRVINDLSEREAAALNQAETYHQWGCDRVKELARVQAICDATVVQVQRHAATIIDLRQEETASRRQWEELLTWQRGAREAWDAYDAQVDADTLDAMRRAIEADPQPWSPSGETKRVVGHLRRTSEGEPLVEPKEET